MSFNQISKELMENNFTSLTFIRIRSTHFKISQNSQENTCARVSFLMLQACESVISIKLQSNFRVRHRISLLILRDFKIINFYSPWNHNYLFHLNLLITRSKIWRQSLSVYRMLGGFQNSTPLASFWYLYC